MIGHVTYLSEAAMEAKFGRRLSGKERYSYDYSTEFEVESYLRHQGASFVNRFDANSYLVISRAIDYFDLARAFGGGSLERAVRHARASFLVMSFSSDWLYPPRQSREIVAALEANGLEVRYHNLRSTHGHDAFLLEEAADQAVPAQTARAPRAPRAFAASRDEGRSGFRIRVSGFAGSRLMGVASPRTCLAGMHTDTHADPGRPATRR